MTDTVAASVAVEIAHPTDSELQFRQRQPPGSGELAFHRGTTDPLPRCAMSPWLLLLVLHGLRASGSGGPLTYVVTGDPNSADGVYGEVREGLSRYYRTEPSFGYYKFLYPVSGGRWVLGSGAAYEEREAHYRVEGGGEGGPEATGWEYVYGDNEREGKYKGDPEPDLRVTAVTGTSGGEMVRRQGAETTEGVVCQHLVNLPRTPIHLRWQFIGKNDSRFCDKASDCQVPYDEMACIGLRNITAQQLLEQGGAATEEGVFCKIHEHKSYLPRLWEVIGSEENRTCDLRCDCSGCHDEAFCPWSAGITRDHLLSQVDRYTGMMGLVTEIFNVKEEEEDQPVVEAVGAEPFDSVYDNDGKEWVPITFAVTGLGPSAWGNNDGVYEEVRDGPVVYYNSREGPSRGGYYWFLYPVSGGRWVLGEGETFEESRAQYRVAGGEGGPEATGWEDVRGGGREGEEEEGNPMPDLRVTGVFDCKAPWDELCFGYENVTVKKLLEEKGTEGLHSIVCVGKNRDKWLYISKDRTDPLFCDGSKDCASGLDERNCSNNKVSKFTVRVGGVMAILTKEQREQGGGPTDAGEGGVCRLGKEWRHIEKKDWCNGRSDLACPSGADEDYCDSFTIRESNAEATLTKEQRFEQGGGLTDSEDGVICERTPGEWLLIGKNSREWCDGKNDCSTGSSAILVPTALDELFCPVFTSASFEFPIQLTLGLIALGTCIFIAKEVLATGSKPEEEPKVVDSEIIKAEAAADVIVEFARRCGKTSTKENEILDDVLDVNDLENAECIKNNKELSLGKNLTHIVIKNKNTNAETIAADLVAELVDSVVDLETDDDIQKRGVQFLPCTRVEVLDEVGGTDPAESLKTSDQKTAQLVRKETTPATSQEDDRIDTTKTEQIIADLLDEVVDSAVDASFNNTNEGETNPHLSDEKYSPYIALFDAYKLLHDVPGGVKLVTSIGFTLPIDPASRHWLARFIQRMEKDIHGEHWLACARSKIGRGKVAEGFLDHLDTPGMLKELSYLHQRVTNWIIQLPAKDSVNIFIKLWAHIKAIIMKSFGPLLKSSSYILDIVKDIVLFVYLLDRRTFIDPKCIFLEDLIYFHGTSVVLSGVITGLVIQTSSSIINLSSIGSAPRVWLLRSIIFLSTPIMPVVVILEAISLGVKKKYIEADWARNMEVSACQTWHMYNKVDMEKKKVMLAYSDMKMVECSTEASPQIFLLLVFSSATVLWPKMSGLGLVKDPSSISSYAFLILSLVQTFNTIISSMLAAMNIRQDGQLGLKSKFILGLSMTFQLGARLLLMVPIALMALPSPEEAEGEFPELVYPPPEPSLTAKEASLLLLLPFFFHYISLLHLYARLNITSFWSLSFKDKMLHLLSNTWVSIPVRSSLEDHQVHKSREQLWSLVLAGVNLTMTAALTTKYCQDGAARFPGVMGQLGLTWGESTSRNEFEFCAEVLKCYQVIVKAQVETSMEFLLLFGLPSLLCQVAGAGLLLLYYKTSHPWRALGKERERRCWGKQQGTRRGLQVEKPYWENVSVKMKEPANSGTEPVGLTWRQIPSSPLPQSLDVRVNSEIYGIAKKNNTPPTNSCTSVSSSTQQQALCVSIDNESIETAIKRNGRPLVTDGEVKIEVMLEVEGALNSCSLTMDELNSRDEVAVLVETSELVSVCILT